MVKMALYSSNKIIRVIRRINNNGNNSNNNGDFYCLNYFHAYRTEINLKNTKNM